MSSRPKQSRTNAALSFGLGLAALMLIVALFSSPTPEALAFGRRLGLSALGVHAALILGMTALTFIVSGVARLVAVRRSGILPVLVYGLTGMPIGYVFAFGFEAFGAVGPLATGAGPYEIAVFGLGFLFVAVGSFALLTTALSQFGAASIPMSRRDRVMTAPASGVWVVEGISLVLLTLLHLRSGAAVDALGLTLLALLLVGVLADVALQAVTWRAMDEFMRLAWGEAMAIGLIVALAVGFVYAGAQSLGFVPQAGIYHALTGFYVIYVLASFIHAALRTPEVFAQAGTEKAA